MNKTVSKIFALLLSCMLVCTTVVVPVFADATLPGQKVELASPNAEVEVGATVEIPVTINNPNTLNGVMVKITWDPTLLNADSTYKMGKWNCYTKPTANADGVNMFEAVFDLNGNNAADGVLVFGGAAGYEFEDYETTMSLGTLKFTVLEAAAGKDVVVTVDSVGTYATSLRGTETLDTPVNATIKVAGEAAADPEMTGIEVTANAVEIADADKDDVDAIKAAIKDAITSIKAQWTEGEDTDVSVDDVTITVDTAALTATIAYEGFEDTVSYTVADPIVYYTVTFFVMDEEYEVIEVEEGTAIGDLMPADPEVATYIFYGWCDETGEVVDAETVVNADMDVTADLTKDPMDVNGDDVIDSKDSIYLLNHCALPDLYPVDEDLDFDFNSDGFVNSKDAVYHLGALVLPAIYSLR